MDDAAAALGSTRGPPRARRTPLAWLGRIGVATRQPQRARYNGARVARILAECVRATGGEASARRRVADLAALYRTLDDAGRGRFLTQLALLDDEAAVPRDAAVDALGRGSAVERRLAAIHLRATLGAASLRVLRQFNLLDDGVEFLVQLRADAMRLSAAAPAAAVIDAELLALFRDWFALGNLELRRITWESPAALLEKLAAYEAVHEIRSWADLRHRLESDRRCYAFFHPRMADEPLVFVEVALGRRIASSIQGLLDESAPPHDARAASVANFYSISSTQPGLRGVSFGGFLIKQVVERLRAEFRRLDTFVTLSPVPGFRRWLEQQIATAPATLVAERDRLALARLGGTADGSGVLATAIARDFVADSALAGVLARVLPPLCARYLVHAKRDGMPVDPVARFHFGNGARLVRIDWLADTSPRGLRRSLGLMVNYEYEPARIESNHEAYFRNGTLCVSRTVRRLLRKGEPLTKEESP